MPDQPFDPIATRHSLLNRLKDWGDQTSWQEFFDTYAQLIYNVACKAGLSDVEAQEVVQETIIAVARKIGEFKADRAHGSFGAWLMQLTRWRITDQLRKRRAFDASGSAPRDRSHTPTTARIPDPAGFELEKVWEEEWQNNLINAALERVQRQTSAKHYQIFYLYVIRGIAVEKVAASTGVKPADVYLIKHRLTPLFEQAAKAVESNER